MKSRPISLMLAYTSLNRTSIVLLVALTVAILSICTESTFLIAAPFRLAPNLPTINCDLLLVGTSSKAKIAYAEVSQGVEATSTNFIAGRSTAILLHFCVKQGQSASISGKATLNVNGDTELSFTPTKPILMNGASASAQYGVLIFEPLIFTTVGSASLQLALFDTSLPTHTLDSNTKTFPIINSVQPQFNYLRINLLSNNKGLPATVVVGTPNGDAFSRAVLPLNDQDQWLYVETTKGGISINTAIDTNGNGIINLTEHNKLLEFLSLQRSMISMQIERDGVEEAIGPTELTFLYGWLNDYMGEGLVEANGAAIQNPGRVGFGSTTQLKGQETYIHEVLHNIGLDHTPNPIVGAGWDVAEHLPSGWLVSGLFQRKPPFFTSVMNENHNSFTSNSWVRDIEYDYLLNHYSSEKLQSFVAKWPICDGEGQIGEPCILQNNILLRGAFDERGVELVDRAPAFQSSWYSQPTYTYSSITQLEQLPFRMVFQGVVGPGFRGQEGILREIPFDARVATNPDDGTDGMRYGAFELIVPASLVDRATSISVRNINGDIVTYQTKTRARPSIQFVNLESGDLLSNQIVVDVFDEDNPREGELECNFTYSRDNGDTWQPLATQLPCTHSKQLVVDIDLQRLPISEGQGAIEAFVSDGLNVGRNSRFDIIVRSELNAYFEQTGLGGTPSIIDDALVFQVHANAPTVGEQDGAGIASIEMTILGQDGRSVYESNRQSARYCAFGDSKSTCSAWVFAEHDNRWPSGEVIQSGFYTLRAQVNGHNNSQKTIETTIEIQEAKSSPRSSIRVIPHSGTVGTDFSIEFSSFKPGEEVDLKLVFAESGEVVYNRQFTMDPLGNRSIQVTSQLGDATGHYLVIATGSDGSAAQDSFDLESLPTVPSIQPSLRIVPHSGTIDTDFTVEISSFAPNEQVELNFTLVETGQVTFSTLVTLDQAGNDIVSVHFQPSDQVRHYIVSAKGQAGSFAQDSVEVR